MSDPDMRRGVLAWFARNHVAANLLMVILLVTGAASLYFIRVEVFQTIDPGIIRVQVPYPGSSPAEVEESICQRVEEAIKGIEGIKKIRSVANEGVGSVVAELEDYAEDREVLDDIKAAVDQIENFPPRDAEEPVVVDVDSRIQVISMAIYGDVPERTLKELADQVRDDLTAMDDISLVEIAGVRRYEVSIEVSEESLRRHGLSFSQVSNIVQKSSLDLPGGSVKTSGGEILIRTKGQRYVGRDFEDIVLLNRPDGTKLYLADIATVIDGFEDSDMATYFDGKPAAFLKVYRIGNQGALTIEKTVKDYVGEKQLPEGVEISTWFNRASFLRGRIQLLVRNAMIGLTLVFLCLTLFLDLRLAFWTTMGIPIAFLGGFCLMPLFGVSVNMISLFALIVVLGIVVDDCIVVGENVFAYRQKGVSRLKASILGVRELAKPVSVAVLTTMAAFFPLQYTEGQLGKILWPVSVVVVCVLAMSLVDALLILPAHLSAGKKRPAPGPIARVQGKFRNALNWLIHGPYTALLKRAIAWRYVTVAVGFAIFVTTLGFIGGGHMGFRFLPQMDAERMWAVLTMPQGTPVEETRKVVTKLEDAVKEIRRELDAERSPDEPSVVKHISTTIGQQPFNELASGGPMVSSSFNISRSHLAEIDVELVSGEYRKLSSMALAQRWREKVGEVPGISSLTFNSELFSGGEAINIELSHQRDYNTALVAAEALKKKLTGFEGVEDIADSFEPGKVELQLDLTDLGYASGLTLGDLARQVRQGFYGDEVQRVQRGRDDIKVMVRYPEAERRSLAGLDNMRIRLPDGTEVPFRLVADVQEGRGYAQIDRTSRRRVVSVTAGVDDKLANANEVNQVLGDTVLPALQESYPGLEFRFEGEQYEQKKSTTSLFRNLAIALLVIFSMLAVQFRSYAQPLIVMSAIPFGLIGAVIGHLIMGFDFSMLSLFGLVALTGVVVNDSLVMIDLVNRQRRRGPDGRQDLSLDEVLIISGTRRFRPIVLTTATTFLGLTPMILEKSLQAQFLIPMAVSLGFGVVFATSITLILVPALYRILEDLKGLVGYSGDRELDEDEGWEGDEKTSQPAAAHY